MPFFLEEHQASVAVAPESRSGHGDLQAERDLVLARSARAREVTLAIQGKEIWAVAGVTLPEKTKGREREVSNDVLVDFLERLTSKVRDGFFVHVAERAADHGPGRSICVLVPRPEAL